MLFSILKVVFIVVFIRLTLYEVVKSILFPEEQIKVRFRLRVILFIMLSLWVFYCGTKFNYTLPKFGFVFTIIIVIFLSLLAVFLFLLVAAFNYDLVHRESDCVRPTCVPPPSSPVDDQNQQQICGTTIIDSSIDSNKSSIDSNKKIIERQRAIIRKNKRELREIRRELKGTRDEIERMKLYGIKVRILNFAFSVITGIIASILFHYLSELLHWN